MQRRQQTILSTALLVLASAIYARADTMWGIYWLSDPAAMHRYCNGRSQRPHHIALLPALPGQRRGCLNLSRHYRQSVALGPGGWDYCYWLRGFYDPQLWDSSGGIMEVGSGRDPQDGADVFATTAGVGTKNSKSRLLSCRYRHSARHGIQLRSLRYLCSLRWIRTISDLGQYLLHKPLSLAIRVFALGCLPHALEAGLEHS